MEEIELLQAIAGRPLKRVGVNDAASVGGMSGGWPTTLTVGGVTASPLRPAAYSVARSVSAYSEAPDAAISPRGSGLSASVTAALRQAETAKHVRISHEGTRKPERRGDRRLPPQLAAALAEPRVLGDVGKYKRGVAPAVSATLDLERDALEDATDNWITRHGLQRNIPYRLDKKQRRELRRFFQLMDADGSGEISIAELENPLLSTGMVVNHRELEELVTATDLDHSGAIDFFEFLHAWKPAAARKGDRMSRAEAAELAAAKAQGVEITVPGAGAPSSGSSGSPSKGAVALLGGAGSPSPTKGGRAGSKASPRKGGGGAAGGGGGGGGGGSGDGVNGEGAGEEGSDGADFESLRRLLEGDIFGEMEAIKQRMDAAAAADRVRQHARRAAVAQSLAALAAANINNQHNSSSGADSPTGSSSPRSSRAAQQDSARDSPTAAAGAGGREVSLLPSPFARAGAATVRSSKGDSSSPVPSPRTAPAKSRVSPVATGGRSGASVSGSSSVTGGDSGSIGRGGGGRRSPTNFSMPAPTIIPHPKPTGLAARVRHGSHSPARSRSRSPSPSPAERTATGVEDDSGVALHDLLQQEADADAQAVGGGGKRGSSRGGGVGSGGPFVPATGLSLSAAAAAASRPFRYADPLIMSQPPLPAPRGRRQSQTRKGGKAGGGGSSASPPRPNSSSSGGSGSGPAPPGSSPWDAKADLLSIPAKIGMHRRRFLLSIITGERERHAEQHAAFASALRHAIVSSDHAEAESVRSRMRQLDKAHQRRVERMQALALVIDKEQASMREQGLELQVAAADEAAAAAADVGAAAAAAIAAARAGAGSAIGNSTGSSTGAGGSSLTAAERAADAALEERLPRYRLLMEEVKALMAVRKQKAAAAAAEVEAKQQRSAVAEQLIADTAAGKSLHGHMPVYHHHHTQHHPQQHAPPQPHPHHPAH